MSKRYVDDGIYESMLKSWGQWATCPKCNECGILKATKSKASQENVNELKFFCTHCHLTIDHQNYLNFSNTHYLQISQRCQFCGGKWLQAKQKISNSGHLPTVVSSVCSICHKTSSFSANTRNTTIHRPSQIGTTNFGLQLYLQEPTRHGLIFVYNPQHLAELKSFIEASLRERTQNTGNGAYYSRLPAWIKSARHRKDVLKALA